MSSAQIGLQKTYVGQRCQESEIKIFGNVCNAQPRVDLDREGGGTNTGETVEAEETD